MNKTIRQEAMAVRREGAILPVYRPRWLPFLKTVAAVTAFALTVTGLLPSGWAASHSTHDQMRVKAAEESTAQNGLEEALTGSNSSDAGTLSRRDFLKTATTGVLSAATFSELLQQMAEGQEPLSGEVPPADAPADVKAGYFLEDRSLVRLFDILEWTGSRYQRKPVTRVSWARGLPLSYDLDPQGARLLVEAIAAESKETGKNPQQVGQRYFEELRDRQNARSYSYSSAVALIGFVTLAQKAKNRKQKQRWTSQARAVAEALARMEQKKGLLGYSYTVAGQDRHDFSIQTGTLAWVGQALLAYRDLIGPNERFADGRPVVEVAEGLAKTILTYQRGETGLVLMGTRDGKNLPHISTEYNIDSFFFLRDLGVASGKEAYAKSAEQIATGIERHLYDAEKKRFRRGFQDDEQVLDTNSWGGLFLLARNRPVDAQAVRDYIETAFRRRVSLANGKTLVGYAPHIRDGFVWSEGSLGVVLLDRRLGQEEEAIEVELSLQNVQTPMGGIRYASPVAWSRGLGPDASLFTTFPDVASSGWLILAGSEKFWAAQSGLEEVTQASVAATPTSAPAQNFWSARGATPTEQGPGYLLRLDAENRKATMISLGQIWHDEAQESKLDRKLKQQGQSRWEWSARLATEIFPRLQRVPSLKVFLGELDGLKKSANPDSNTTSAWNRLRTSMESAEDFSEFQSNAQSPEYGRRLLAFEQLTGLIFESFHPELYSQLRDRYGEESSFGELVRVGWSDETIDRIEQLHQQGFDVTLLALGEHGTELARHLVESFDGALTLVAPVMSDGLWNQRNPWFVEATNQSTSEEALPDLQAALAANESLNAAVREAMAARIEDENEDLAAEAAEWQSPVQRPAWMGRLGWAAAAAVIAAGVLGTAATAIAQQPSSPAESQLLVPNPALGNPLVSRPLDPAAQADAALGELPVRVQAREILEKPVPGPGVVGKVTVTAPADPKAPLQVDFRQTPVPRVLSTSSDFARSPGQTAVSKLTQALTGIDARLRKELYGPEDPDAWTASKEPTKAVIVPGRTVGYTLWRPDRLAELSDAQVRALFASVGQGARRNGSQVVLLYESNWPVTLRGAQGNDKPAAMAVLAKVRRHIELAHQNGIKVVPMYSGIESLLDPDAVIQHLEVALGMGFDTDVVVTDVELWAIDADKPEGVWMRAKAELDAAVARNDPQAIAQARQKLLQAAMIWYRLHEEILKRAVPENRAHLETVPGLPSVHAFVQPAFVPYLKLALQWDQIQKQVAQKDPSKTAEAWAIFDAMTTSGKPWTAETMAAALKQKQMEVDPADVQVQLPERLKLVVMAYVYPEGQEAGAVAELMRMAHADGFAPSLGLAVNLEPESPAALSLGNRSEQAGRLVEQITQALAADATTGFDGKTVYAHVTDELALIDMARDGKLSPARHLTPKRLEGTEQFVGEVGSKVFGVPLRRVEEQRRVPVPETLRQYAHRQAVAVMWGSGGGIVGIGPWYALEENLESWMVRDLAVLHPDTGPVGPEAGGSEKALSIVVGALASGQVEVTDMRLRLVKRGTDGRVVRDLTVQHIPGKNSPIISDDVWDEATLEVTVHRTGKSSRLPVGLVVDMAAKVENRYAAPGETPREEWTSTTLMPWQQQKTFQVPLPRLIAGANALTLLTHDNQGKIVEWLGPGQNPMYLTPHAPTVVAANHERLQRSKQELSDLRKKLGKKAAERLSAEELLQEGRQDLIADQEALSAVNELSVRTSARAEVMVWHTLKPGMTVDQMDSSLSDFKWMGGNSVAVRVPGLEKMAREALDRSENNLYPFGGSQLTRPEMKDLVQLIRIAHRHGLEVNLVLEPRELLRIAEEAEELDQSRQVPRSRDEIVGTLIRLLLEANEILGWNIDGIAFDQRVPSENERQAIERVVREGLDASLVVIGPDGRTSNFALFSQRVELGSNVQRVLAQVDAILSQETVQAPREHRFSRSILLDADGSLAAAVHWLAGLKTVETDAQVQRQFLERLLLPDASTMTQMGYPPAVVDQVADKARHLAAAEPGEGLKSLQQELTDAAQAQDKDRSAALWARALVEGKASELRVIAEQAQVERYGTPLEHAMLDAYGIQVTPLVLTEAQRAEVVPLVPKHVVSRNGNTWLGVQVTNPADPRVVQGPAVYDVWVHVDFPSWLQRPRAVHKTMTLILKPGETAPAWVELEGVPSDEDSLAVRVRVVPRGAEEYKSGQLGTRSDQEQAIELSGFVIHGSPRPFDSLKRFGDEIQDFQRYWTNWAAVYGITPAHPAYNRLLVKKAEEYFGVGTPTQRATVKTDPATGQMKIEPVPIDPRAVAQAEASKVRESLAHWYTERLQRVQERPDRAGARFLTALYTGAALIGSTLIAAGYVLGALKGYYRARLAQRHYHESRQDGVRLLATGGIVIQPPTGVTQAYPVTQDEAIQITSPLGAKFSSVPSQLHSGQQQPGRAMSVYQKHAVVVLSDEMENQSENIRRTPVQSPETQPTAAGRAAAQRARFQRAAPTLLGMTALAGAGAFLMGTPAGWLAGGIAVAATVWTALAFSQRLQQAAGWVLSLPAVVSRSAALNHPVTTILLGAAAITGVYFLGTALAVPMAIVWVAALVWLSVVEILAMPPTARVPGALGFTALATTAVSFIVKLTLPIWWKVALVVAVILIVQRLLMNWLDAEQPMEGLLFSVANALRFTVKWGLFAAVIYAAGGILHPFLWAGVLEVPVLGVLGQWTGLSAVFSGATTAGLLKIAGVAWVATTFVLTLYALVRDRGQFPAVHLRKWIVFGIGAPAGAWAFAMGTAALFGAPATLGVWLVGMLAGFNLANQIHMYLNRLAAMGGDSLLWLLGNEPSRRDGFSVLLSGLGVPALALVAFWIWGMAPAAAVLTYIIAGGLLLQLIALGLSAAVTLFAWIRSRFERAEGIQRTAPDQQVLADADPALYQQARVAAAQDTTKQSQWGISLGPPQPGEQLSPHQQRFVNMHYWRLLAIQEAQALPNFQGLSTQDQQRLINAHLLMHVIGHIDTLIGQDAGTTLRTLLYGLWTGRMSDVVHALRNDDRLAVVMPALLLSFSWTPSDAAPRLAQQPWLIFWEVFRMLLVSYAVPLGFMASMVNRAGRSMFTQDANMMATLRLRGDAGLRGYKDPIDYVLKVMGRWLVGHIHILMRAYLGRRVSRNAAELLAAHRWDRKQGLLYEHIDQLLGEADQAYAAGQVDAYRQGVGAALYAALAGEKPLFFDVGRIGAPNDLNEVEWNAVADEDGLYDDSFFGPEFNQGTVEGLAAVRYDAPRFQGVHVYIPMKVEPHVQADGTTDWVFTRDPGKFHLVMPFGSFVTKARLADTALQFFQGRFSLEAQALTGLEEPNQPPTHRLQIRFLSQEQRFFPEIHQAQDAIEVPTNRFAGARRAEGVEGARQMARRRHERLLGDGDDTTETLKGQIGYEGYQDRRGLWYQLRLNLFGWLRARYLGLNAEGRPTTLRALGWWALTVGTGLAATWLTGSVLLGTMLIVAPWILSILYGSIMAVSFVGMGVQDTIIQGMKGHYDGPFLDRAMNGFFADQSVAPMPAPGQYRDVLSRGLNLIQYQNPSQGSGSPVDEELMLLVDAYPRAMHPEDEILKRAGIQLADPALVARVRRVIPRAPANRWGLRRAIRDEILRRVAEKIEAAAPKSEPDQAILWRAFREAFVRNTQMELAAIGNEVAGIQYQRSHDPDVFRAGDVNYQLATGGQDPLSNQMTGLGVPWLRDRTWAYPTLQGPFYGAVRMPSLAYRHTGVQALDSLADRARRSGIILEAAWMDTGSVHAIVRFDVQPTDPRYEYDPARYQSHRSSYQGTAAGILGLQANQVEALSSAEIGSAAHPIPAGALRRVLPLEDYLNHAEAGQTVNQFTLDRSHLQPDLDVADEFFREESREMASRIPADLTVDQVNQYLTNKEQRLGLPANTFVRLRPADQGWLTASIRRLAARVRNEGTIRESAAARVPEGVAETLGRLRWWVILGTVLVGLALPKLWIVAGVAWLLGLSPVTVAMTSLLRWIQPVFLAKVLMSGSSDPYSDDVVFLNVIYGVVRQQVVRFGGRIVNLRWSGLDGMHDSARLQSAVGTYLFPGTPIARIPGPERAGGLIHSPPVLVIEAVRTLEEPPWLAPASGFNRLPTDAFELGESLAEDTLFGLVNLHEPTLNPTMNAMNIQKPNYLFGHQELRKRDEAATRAIQLFKGMGIAQSLDHLFDHPLVAGAGDADLQAITRLSFGMEAYRKDEVAAAGGTGSSTLAYGYTGFTLSNLFGQRVGRAPGTTAAYWNARFYQELNARIPGLFQTIANLQHEHEPARVTGVSRDALLRGVLVDPFVPLAMAGAARRPASAVPTPAVPTPAIPASAAPPAEQSQPTAGLEEPVQTDRMETLGLTVAAQRQLGGRANQEDTFGWTPVLAADGTLKGQIFLAADGMGGYEGGEEASAAFITGIPALLTGENRLRSDDGLDLAELLSQGREADVQALVTQAFTGVATYLKEEDALQQMGTTGLMVLISRSTAYVAWVGDTRLYLNRNQTLQLLTEDDSRGWLHLRAQDPDSDNLVIARQYHTLNLRGKNALSQDIGIKGRVNVHWLAVPLQPGDRLLLSTDGVHEAIADEKAIDIVLNPPGSPEAAVETLMDLAQDGSDNRAAVVVDFAGLPAAGEPGPSTSSGRTEGTLLTSPVTVSEPVPAPMDEILLGRGDSVELEPSELPAWLHDLQERQLIVLAPDAVQKYTALADVVGQVQSVGKLSFVVLPSDRAGIQRLASTLVLDPQPTTVREFGVEKDESLDYFDMLTQGAFSFALRQPLEGADFRALMRQIFANLAGVEAKYISDEELDRIGNALGLGVQL